MVYMYVLNCFTVTMLNVCCICNVKSPSRDGHWKCCDVVRWKIVIQFSMFITSVPIK